MSTLKESVTRLGGVISQFFQYDNNSSQWHEAVTFAFTLPNSGGVRVVNVDFYKEQATSETFQISYRCNLNGEWVTRKLKPFPEVKEFYRTSLFTIYVEMRCLEIFWDLATNYGDELPPDHLKPLNTMIELLRRDVGNYIRLFGGDNPSEAAVKIHEQIKQTYKSLGIDSTGFW
jgi:hypothetical protein